MSEACWLTTEYHIRHYPTWWTDCFGPQAWPMRLPGSILLDYNLWEHHMMDMDYQQKLVTRAALWLYKEKLINYPEGNSCLIDIFLLWWYMIHKFLFFFFYSVINICTVKLWVSAMHIHWNAHSGVMFDNSVYVDTEFLYKSLTWYCEVWHAIWVTPA